MKIIKYFEFIRESNSETPESNIGTILTKLKTRIDKMFSDSGSGSIDRLSDMVSKNKKNSGHMSFKELGLNMESSEVSKYSKTSDNYKVKFSDNENLYDLTVSISLETAISDDDSDVEINDIKDCEVKFKKYGVEDFNLIGEISKECKIDDIDEDFLINLKIEIDEEFGSEEEEFEIETN